MQEKTLKELSKKLVDATRSGKIQWKEDTDVHNTEIVGIRVTIPKYGFRGKWLVEIGSFTCSLSIEDNRDEYLICRIIDLIRENSVFERGRKLMQFIIDELDRNA
jgi:hypothetical protein